MKVCVISGSPKGENSVTLQTVLYLAKRFPRDEFVIFHAGQRIRSLERGLTPLREALKDVKVVLFCYPVYTFLVPSQLHRLIELMKDPENGIDMRGKYAAQISTSMHFYDMTAQEFIRENCLDMGMRYLGGLSAGMDDLLKKEGRSEAFEFWKLVHWKAKEHIYETAGEIPARHDARPSGSRERRLSHFQTPAETVIVSAAAKDDLKLKGMIDEFRAVYQYPTKVVDLADFPFKGGCLGCMNCASDGKCVYRDGFDAFLREQVQGGSAIVYAFTVRDHSMGSLMKTFDDRQFCNGHRTVTAGSPVGYIVNGDLSCEPNLRTLIEARAQVGGNFLAGCAQDSRGISCLAETLAYALRHGLRQPQNFYGVGGMKIFRDLIWKMQGFMKEDHRYYRENGLYDFPQRDMKTMLMMRAVGAMLENPKLASQVKPRMNEAMLSPYRKIME